MDGDPAGARTDGGAIVGAIGGSRRPVTKRGGGLLDRIAIGLSGFCALHCLVAPIVVVVFPMLAASLGSERFHLGLAVLGLPSSGIALVLGCRRHRDAGVLALGLLGLGALVVLGLWGHAALGELGERVGTAGASGVMVLAHVRNHRLCRRHTCET
jgi:hypothetical protein